MMPNLGILSLSCLCTGLPIYSSLYLGTQSACHYIAFYFPWCLAFIAPTKGTYFQSNLIRSPILGSQVPYSTTLNAPYLGVIHHMVPSSLQSQPQGPYVNWAILSLLGKIGDT